MIEAHEQSNINIEGFKRIQAALGVMPRVGEPEEVAKIALFLASDDSSFINGTVIKADAGWNAAF